MMSSKKYTLCTAVGALVLLGSTGGAGATQAASSDGAALFQQQCSACHSTVAGDAPRQGPNLSGVFGRKPGSVPGFDYSPGFAKAHFVWDAKHLDAYLTDPQAVIPGAVMPYRQKKPAVRRAIIAWLEGRH